jgi:intraflagellar transport protein 122
MFKYPVAKIIAGSNKKVMLYSRDGMRLAEIAKKTSWVWGVACGQTGTAAASNSSDFDRVVLGSDAGGIDAIQLLFESVHSLYRDRYAYRENLTEIIVHNLVSDKKVRIKCKDLIKNISMYKNKLAVQLTDRVCIYESSAEESLDMHFRLRKERISIGTPNDKSGKEPVHENKTTAMAVTSQNLLFCQDNLLEIYGLDGQRLRVWKLDATVTFMKVDGGPEGREGILLGLVTGTVVKIFVDNPFPIELYRAPSAASSSSGTSSTQVDGDKDRLEPETPCCNFNFLHAILLHACEFSCHEFSMH